MATVFRFLFIMGVSVGLAACATTARVTLEDRFQAIGLPPETAGCMVDRLSDDLSSSELQDLARYTVNVSRADTTLGALQALSEFDNPRAVAAIGRAGLGCVTGFNR